MSNASASNIASDSNATVDSNVARGYKLVYRAIDILGFGIAVACAWSCSSLVMGTIMLLIMGIVMALLAYAAKWFTMLTVSPDRMNSIGGFFDTSRITNMFKRDPAPAATPA